MGETLQDLDRTIIEINAYLFLTIIEINACLFLTIIEINAYQNELNIIMF